MASMDHHGGFAGTVSAAIAFALALGALSSTAATAAAIGGQQLVRVATPSEREATILQTLGLDLTEHARGGFRDVVLATPAQGAVLRAAGLNYRIRIADLGAYSVQRARADRQFARTHQTTALPSGRNTYRRLPDYIAEMRQLADNDPKLVRHFTMPNRTYEGRRIHGLEIGPARARREGRPAFLMLGLHHAREWPSGEHAMEWAYEVINGWKAGNKKARRLLRRARMIVVPVVNPDGFNTSREAGELQGGGDGRGGDDLRRRSTSSPTPTSTGARTAAWRSAPRRAAACSPSFGLVELGVDPNRNYGAFWGGPGASTDPTAEDYRGPAPFSEPETRNIQRLVSAHQVTMLITNHTFSDLVLRPPGVATQGEAPDEEALKRLGAAMADENGYANQHGYELYDTTGTTEDWSYYATGGFGYTFEIGPSNFHPPFADVVAEWQGTTEAAGEGGGNRAALTTRLGAGRGGRPSHSILRGRAPRSVRRIELTKRFMTKTSPVIGGSDDGRILEFEDVLRIDLQGPRGPFLLPRQPLDAAGFQWAAAAESRPARRATPIEFSGGTETTDRCADFDTEDPACFNDHPFRVPMSKKFDNESATVRIEWPTPVSDWDMKIFRDSDRRWQLRRRGRAAQPFGQRPLICRAGDGGEASPRGALRGPGHQLLGARKLQRPDRVHRAAGRREVDVFDASAETGKALGQTKVSVKRGRTKAVDLRRACR